MMKIISILFFQMIPVIGPAQDTTDLYPVMKGSLVCWTESRSSPRPLKIHFTRVDLTCNRLEVITLTGEDPDGAGPAESKLTPPADLFTRYHALVAVNANAFAGMPGTEKDIRGWYRNRPVDIHGMAVGDGKVVSPVEKGRMPFWTDSANHPHLGNPKAGDLVWSAVSDWSSPLLLNGIMVPDSTVHVLHPRSALGFDDTGKWLLLAVVNGRQPGYSEGMSLSELARLFRQKGCTQAINLDGGGSSIMLIQIPKAGIKTVNSPSGLGARPVPVMIGVRAID